MSKQAVYRTVCAMLRENGMSPTDFVVAHIKHVELEKLAAERKLQEEKDRGFNQEADKYV